MSVKHDVLIRVLRADEPLLAKKIAKEADLLTFNERNYLQMIQDPQRKIYVAFDFNDHFCGMVATVDRMPVYYISSALDRKEIEAREICSAYSSKKNHIDGLVQRLADCCLDELLRGSESRYPIAVRVRGNRNITERALKFERRVRDFAQEKFRGVAREDAKTAEQWAISNGFRKMGFASTHLGPVYIGVPSDLTPQYTFRKLSKDTWVIWHKGKLLK